MINNLILNAITHASQPVLHIRLDKETLVFENPSDTPVHDDPTQPKVKQSQSEGFGQGLFLVRRVLETLNWEYKVRSDGGYFRFSIIPNKV